MPEKPGRKEPETAQTFDETAYKDDLIDNQGYSPETATMLASKKKEKLAEAPTPVTKMVEIDLSEL